MEGWFLGCSFSLPHPSDWVCFPPGRGWSVQLSQERGKAELGQVEHGKQEMGTVGMRASLRERAWNGAES